jgi:glycosyltransferase involved in cell wall biosynthesis
MTDRAHTEQNHIFQPVQILDIELSAALPALTTHHPENEQGYRSILALIWLHSVALGQVELQFDGNTLSPEQCAGQIWQALGARINQHLRQDSLDDIRELTAAGISTAEMPACQHNFMQFLADAPFVSVILCTRDRADQLPRCMDAVLALQYPAFEVVVVDNAPSSTATEDLLRTQYAGFSNVRYVCERRPGLSWARNCGLANARGEIVVYLDDDEIPYKNWLGEMIRGFQAAPDVTCVTGMILPAEIEAPAQDFLEQFGGLSKGRGFDSDVFDQTTRHKQNPLYPVPAYGAGGNMAFKTAALRQFGGFDVALGTGTPACGAEDTAAFFDVLIHGGTLVYWPIAIVRHYHRRDYRGLRKQLYGYGVGLSAYVVRSLLKHPKCILDLLKIVPTTFNYIFNPRSARVAKMRSNYPHELTRAQYQGMVYGPLAYVRSYWRQRQLGTHTQ